MRITATKWLAALLATMVLAACDCKPRQRVDLPTGAAYRSELERVQRLAGVLDIELLPYRLKRGSVEGRIFERLGFVRFDGERPRPNGRWRSRVIPSIPTMDDVIDVPIGHQQIDALTYAERDGSGYCASYGSLENDVGYRAHVDRLNELGRELVAAHLLSIGFMNDTRPWDGRTHRIGVLSVSADDDSATPRHLERGEEIQLSSYFAHFYGVLPG